MKNLKRLFILFVALCVFAVGTVRAEEVGTVEDTTVTEVAPGVVVNEEGETLVENNEIVDEDGEAEVEADDSFTVGADSLLDFALDTLPEGAVVAGEEETYRDAEMVLEEDVEEKREEKEANIVAILIVVVLIAAFLVGGIVLLSKKSKTEEVKEEK